MASEWKPVTKDSPPVSYHNILFAFREHWNQVVGFRSGVDEFYETSAHNNNSRIFGEPPDWWCEIPEAPHRGR